MTEAMLRARAVRQRHQHAHRTRIPRAFLFARVATFGPLKVDVDGRRLVFWRGDDGIVAMDDLCIHRASPLSRGDVVRDVVSGRRCISCKYHRWSFDAEGRIADIPTEPERRWPKRRVQRTYDIEYRDWWQETVVIDRFGVSTGFSTRSAKDEISGGPSLQSDSD